MLRVVCVSKKTFLPFWGGFISPSLGQNWTSSLHSYLASFLHPSLSEISLCAFVVLELFQEQTADGKDSYFQEKQKMGCSITQHTPAWSSFVWGAAVGCILTHCSALVPVGSSGSFPELFLSSPWAAGQLCHGWAVEPMAQRLCLPVSSLCSIHVRKVCVLAAGLLGWQYPLQAEGSTLLQLGCWSSCCGGLIFFDLPQSALT